MNTARIQNAIDLAPYTSFKVGGPAEHFADIASTDQLIDILHNTDITPVWLIGYGSNTLISDEGLPGLTLHITGGDIQVQEHMIIADAGVWWDDVVQAAIAHNLWGIELMSEIPGSVGAAAYINIAAYGQSIGPRIEWVDVWDPRQSTVKRINRADLKWDYKRSQFQTESYADVIILRVCIALDHSRSDELTYQKAVDVADELGLDTHSLADRRKIITEARHRAGSIWSASNDKHARTVGSFFRNPVVTAEQRDAIIQHDESRVSAEQIKRMNTTHGGNEQRVSAAHVMLAAGFERGQTWGKVKLNDKNLLKIEALPGATAQEIYDVVQEIIRTCKERLNVTLIPEARILGTFGR